MYAHVIIALLPSLPVFSTELSIKFFFFFFLTTRIKKLSDIKTFNDTVYRTLKKLYLRFLKVIE